MEDNINDYEAAIRAMEFCAESYKVLFSIIKGHKRKYSGKWKVVVMDKVFFDMDFIVAIREAVKFVYNAHNIDNPVK